MHQDVHVITKPRNLWIAVAVVFVAFAGLSTAQPSPLPVFFTGEVGVGGGTTYELYFPGSNYFGFYGFDLPSWTTALQGWIYHDDLGWEYFEDDGSGTGGAYLYDLATSHWWWTSPADFPDYIYDFTLSAWLQYQTDSSNPGHYSSNPRFFLNRSTGLVIQLGSNPLTLSEFTDCISYNNYGHYGTECTLASSGTPYVIDGPSGSQPELRIGRSSLVISSLWPYATIQRNAVLNSGSSATTLMTTYGSVSDVTVLGLIFDGNTEGHATLTTSGADVDVQSCQGCILTQDEFDNSGNEAVRISSTANTQVLWSLFQNAKYSGIWTSTAGACSSGTCLYILNSQFFGNGGSGIAILMSKVHIEGNTLNGNVVTCPDVAAAGQIFVDAASDTVTITGNTIENAPACSNSFWGNGLELHGTNLDIHDNIITGNAGEGIYLAGVQNVNIYNVNAPSSSPIANNNAAGLSWSCSLPGAIRIHTASSDRALLNITINNVWSVGSQTYGVAIDSCNDGSYYGSPVTNLTVTNSCMAPNTPAVKDFHNCVSGGSSCIGSSPVISNNQTSGCGGY